MLSPPWRFALLTQGLWGPVVSPGASLQEALTAHCCREVIRDAACTRCSLKATLSQVPESAAAATSAAMQRLQGLLRAGCPLPDCDFEVLAAAAGLAWQERRGPLLKRTLIARPPEVGARLGVSPADHCVLLHAEERFGTLLHPSQVHARCTSVVKAPVLGAQVLCLQLRRVVWSNLGRLTKLAGHVAFPQLLDLQQALAATAEPLLPCEPCAPPPAAAPSVASLLWAVDALPSSSESRRFAAAPATEGDKAGDRRACKATDIGESEVSCSAGVGHCPAEQHHDVTRTRPSCWYRLISVIVHKGGVRSGHYLVYRLVRCIPEARLCNDFGGNAKRCAQHLEQIGDGSGQGSVQEWWVCCSDEQVRRVDLKEVMNAEAALLLYERCKPP